MLSLLLAKKGFRFSTTWNYEKNARGSCEDTQFAFEDSIKSYIFNASWLKAHARPGLGGRLAGWGVGPAISHEQLTSNDLSIMFSEHQLPILHGVHSRSLDQIKTSHGVSG